MSAHTGPLLAERDGLRVINCQTCGWAHLDPLPDERDLAAYYTDEFWQKDKADWLARYEAQRDWDEMRAGDWLGIAETLTAGRSLLDIGAGYGQFIEVAGRRGWTAVGVEPSRAAAEYARGRGQNIVAVGWRDMFGIVPASAAECVSALWVLEHEVNPLQFLECIRPSCKLLILAVPNEFSRDQINANAMTAVKTWWVHKTHVNYFTPASIANLLGRAGFVIVDTLGTYPMEHFIAAGRDYTAGAEVGDSCHADVRNWEMRLAAVDRVGYQRAIALFGIGRDLIIFARPA